METILKEHEKVSKKHATLAQGSIDSIDRIIGAINEARAQFENCPQSCPTQLYNLSRRVKDITSQTLDEHKDFQSTLNKYGKAIDKKWKQDITIATNANAFSEKEKILQKTIALHFIRQGKFELGNTFMREAELDISDMPQAQFVEMYQILEAIKVYDLGPALIWARSKREELERRGSSLEFQLHRLHFVQFLTNQRSEEAIIYARKNFHYFQERHLAEIQRLMGSMVYFNNLNSSPYAELLSPDAWTDIQHQFTRDFCSLLGMSWESPLFISVTVGAMALPTIIKMATIMKEKKNEWSQQDELPVEIPLPDDMRYHSIFACPVSKEQSTEENPPMMMPCGHVICKESLNKLSKANSRFKCPYCPNESTLDQAIRVHF
ncbi:1255_t:CDS:2 [Paraglomus brasilianum]|uniref:GID complex catalytic subunit 2 n=1 Tax=Paraglomus brasilianum TaxID=144538 RepID=A0A9N8YYD2_9GLOM|nr:1255_t:CDS:2 [Paraglomus brasilianum]